MSKLKITKGCYKLNRTEKLKMNTVMSLLNRVAILLSGLILPRIILLNYGSETNGLVASVTQFLGIITFLDLGVGSVVQSALYKPLAEKDARQLSRVLSSAKNYFRKISYVLVAYIVILIFTYPTITNNQGINFISTALLIFAIAISQFAQYYFGVVNELLLNSDQRGYIQLSTEIIVVVLNLLASIFLINQGASIQFVKLTTSLIYLIRPIYLNYYVKKNYNLDFNIKVTEDLLPQKWSGMAQHIAYSVQNSTDIMVLTLFSTLENVSIYSIYNMVVNAIKLIITSFSVGLTSFFGNLLASQEMNLLNSYFSKIEWGIHTLVIFLYGMTAVLINPFVMLYTSGIGDIDYYAPVFSMLLVLARATFSLRTPYQSMILAAGHFKQTRISSIIEAAINIITSALLVNKFGLIGIAMGTLISMIYRTLYLSFYLSKNIINRPINIFIKHILIDVITFILIVVSGSAVSSFITISTIIHWGITAIIIGLISIVIILLINLIFYKDIVIYMIRKVLASLHR